MILTDSEYSGTCVLPLLNDCESQGSEVVGNLNHATLRDCL